MTYKLKNMIYLVLVSSVMATSFAEAKKGARKILCGNGATVIVYDTKSRTATKACLKAGHPAPKRNFKPAAQLDVQASQQQAKNNGKWDPDSARLPEGKAKIKVKRNCKYDKNSAVLPCADKKAVSLLLPAVQAARESGGSACGSSSSVARAMDQCQEKGYKFAACKKKNGNWSCTPSSNKSDPNVRPTGLTNRRKK